MKTTKALLLTALLGLLAVSTAHARGNRGSNAGAGQVAISGTISQVCPNGNVPGSRAQAMTDCDGTGPGQGQGQGQGQGARNGDGTGTPKQDGSGRANAPGNGPKDGSGNNANCPNG